MDYDYVNMSLPCGVRDEHYVLSQRYCLGDGIRMMECSNQIGEANHLGKDPTCYGAGSNSSVHTAQWGFVDRVEPLM